MCTPEKALGMKKENREAVIRFTDKVLGYNQSSENEAPTASNVGECSGNKGSNKL